MSILPQPTVYTSTYQQSSYMYYIYKIHTVQSLLFFHWRPLQLELLQGVLEFQRPQINLAFILIPNQMQLFASTKQRCNPCGPN